MTDRHRPRHEDALADRAGEKIEWAIAAVDKGVTMLRNGYMDEFDRQVNLAKTLLFQALELTAEASKKYNEPRLHDREQI